MVNVITILLLDTGWLATDEDDGEVVGRRVAGFVDKTTGSMVDTDLVLLVIDDD